MSVFIDTNIVLYARDTNPVKKEASLRIINDRPFISTQVILEAVNVCLKKFKLTVEQSFLYAQFLLDNCELRIISESTLHTAFAFSIRYKFSHWDSLILASALEAECTTLYSEDFQHGQVTEGLTIINPFL